MSLPKEENHKPASNKFYKCMSRTNAMYKFSNEPISVFQYTLHSYAKVDFPILDIYKLYFRCILKKSQTQYKSQWIKRKGLYIERNFSILFSTFCRQIFFQCLLEQQQQKTSFVNNILKDMTDEHQYPELVDSLKHIFKRMEQKYQSLFINPNKPRTWSEAQLVLKEIEQNIENMQKQIKDSQIVKTQIENKKIKQEVKVVKEEYLPPIIIGHNNSSNNNNLELLQAQRLELIFYAVQTFKKIKNIQIIRRSKRKQMLQVFLQQNVHLFSNLPKNSNKIENRILINNNIGGDEEPIILPLRIYCRNLKQCTLGPRLEMVRDIIKMLSLYMRQSSKPYPNLKIKSIYMSQKQLKPSYEQGEIILDAIGLAGQTHTIQTEIAFNPTPTFLQYEKCHLQFLDQVQWLLARKYYQPKNKENQEQEYLYLPQNDKVQKQAYNEKDLLENIHVWRLLSVIYFVINLNELSPQIYSKATKNSPFDFTRYKQQLRKTYFSLQNGNIKLSSLLNLKEAGLKQQKSFSFTLKQLSECFQVKDQEDDSMLQNLKFQSFSAQIFERIVFTKEISNLLVQEGYFKKMINAKKYIITYLVNAIEFCYQAAFKIWIQEKRPHSRAKFMIKCQSYNKMSFQNQRKKRTDNIQIIYKKLMEYLSRKDQQQKYLVSQMNTINKIKEAHASIQKISAFQMSFKIQALSVEVQAKNHQDMLEVKRISVQSFNKCVNALQSYCFNELQAKIDRVEEFHKVEDICKPGKHNKQIAYVLSCQLLALIKSYTRLQHSNCKIFNNLILNNLLDNMKDLTAKPLRRPIESIHKQQLQRILENIFIIQTKIDKFIVKDLIFNDQSN